MPLILPQIRTLVRALAMTLVALGTVGTAQVQASPSRPGGEARPAAPDLRR